MRKLDVRFGDRWRAWFVAGLSCVIWAVGSVKPARTAGVDEVWVGALAHDVAHLGGGFESGMQDVLFEIDSRRPAILRPLGAPRVGLAVAANSAGRSDLASLGLVWDHRLYGRLYGSLDLGLAVTNGLIRPRDGPKGAGDSRNRLLLGSHVLFREAIGLDWRLSQRWSIGVEFIHASNGEILGPHHFNRGLNDAGLRLGYRFN